MTRGRWSTLMALTQKRARERYRDCCMAVSVVMSQRLYAHWELSLRPLDSTISYVSPRTPRRSCTQVRSGTITGSTRVAPAPLGSSSRELGEAPPNSPRSLSCEDGPAPGGPLDRALRADRNRRARPVL